MMQGWLHSSPQVPSVEDHDSRGKRGGKFDGLLQEDMQLVSKTMDCLRILTTGNEANKEAIYQIGGTPQDSLQRRGSSTRSSSLTAIMQHMRPDGDPVCVPP